MSAAAVDNALEQAVRFTEQLADTYESQIAAGEVGSSGTAIASELPIRANRPPTILLYGRVQSGKTAAMILTSALALDNGFRIIIVLTANNVALVEQTANRFKDLDGPRVFSSVKEDVYEWQGQENELREDIAADGLVLVCAKDAFHLPQVMRFLQEIEAPSYPALILDDEADAATPDTTAAARSSGRPNAPPYPSTINRRVIENPRPGEEGESIGELFPHSLYVQVTATPYLFFLQRGASRIRPNLTMLLEPGEGYCGGEVFFSGFDPRHNGEADPPLVIVPNGEAQALGRRRVPAGLAASIEFFLVSSLAKSIVDGCWPSGGYKHLSHTSHRIPQHTIVAGHIERHIADIRRQLRNDVDGVMQRLEAAYQELSRTVPEAPSLVDIVRVLPEAVRQAEFIRVNSETDVPHYGPRLNFAVGGNILGRGLTIDDLLVTYYVREAQVSQMDTVWQHARMYGYRLALMPYTRVYLPHRVAARFKEIHEAEQELRAALLREAEGENVIVRVASGTRPTRRNVTEPDTLQVIPAGLEQIFPHFLREDVEVATLILRILQSAGVPIDRGTRADRASPIALETAFELAGLVPVADDDPGRWSADTVTALMESYRDEYRGLCHVYVRGLQTESPPPTGWTRGRLGGPEIQLIQQAARNVPALALLYLGDSDAPRAWYPTLVLPPDRPMYILNPL